jgi:hypothetical protein
MNVESPTIGTNVRAARRRNGMREDRCRSVGTAAEARKREPETGRRRETKHVIPSEAGIAIVPVEGSYTGTTDPRCRLGMTLLQQASSWLAGRNGSSSS